MHGAPRTPILASVTAVLAATALAACAPRTVVGQSQTVDGVRFEYGLVAEPAAGGPPPSHPDAAMHGGAPAQAGAYHVVLSVSDAKTGQKVEATDVALVLSGPGHPGRSATPLDPMTVNGALSYGGYVVLPDPGRYQLEFRVRPPGHHQPTRARFVLQRPT
jgi:hypothetical protein